jgi:hypothetical protein
VPRELAEHSLHVTPDAKSVKQPLRRFTEDRRKVIGDEIDMLLVVGLIMEVLHPNWLANPVLVEKKNDDPNVIEVWCMCINSMARCELLSFVDVYSGFHQIPLNLADQINTSFITMYEAYCDRAMPFGLRNAGDTYQ